MNIDELVSEAKVVFRKQGLDWLNARYSPAPAKPKECKQILPVYNKMKEILSNEELISIISWGTIFEPYGIPLLSANLEGQKVILSLKPDTNNPCFFAYDAHLSNHTTSPLAFSEKPSKDEARLLKGLMQNQVRVFAFREGNYGVPTRDADGSIYKTGLTPEVLEDAVCRMVADYASIAGYKSPARLFEGEKNER